MSILINMEMPKSCITCPLCECRNECAYCEVGDKYLSWDWDERLRSSRNDHCPLTEVPPHGRLIDADALDIYKREQQAWQDYEHNPDNEYLEGVKDGLHEASKQLSTAMTIIKEEEHE